MAPPQPPTQTFCSGIITALYLSVLLSLVVLVLSISYALFYPYPAGTFMAVILLRFTGLGQLPYLLPMIYQAHKQHQTQYIQGLLVVAVTFALGMAFLFRV